MNIKITINLNLDDDAELALYNYIIDQLQAWYYDASNPIEAFLKDLIKEDINE